ncbi:MAG: hypothetical protein FGM55_13005 [Rhodoferax sp.]|nr:hypothetical protein [Rhodoferax sp.]
MPVRPEPRRGPPNPLQLPPGPSMKPQRPSPPAGFPRMRSEPRAAGSVGVIHRFEQGLSLVELMVAMVVGLVVVGAVLAAFAATGRTGRQQAALTDLNDNAQLALALLSRDLAQAGYAQATGLSADGSRLQRTYADRPVFGCQGGFQKPNTVSAVACQPDGDADAIEVVYQAEVANTVPTAANVPTDCLGNGLTAVAGVYTAYNRYYLATGATGRSELHCASRQGAAGQPLIDQVQAMRIVYGEAHAAAPRVPVRYVRAGEVSDWGLVVSVRVCLLMRSADAVLNTQDDSLAYLDCDGATRQAQDGHWYRAYTRTATLRNRAAL